MISNNKGFTLFELMVALIILAVVTVVAYSTFANQNRSYRLQDEVVEMQQNLRAAMTYMTREIRMARSNPLSVLGLTSFVVADTNTLQFTMDTGGGLTDDADNDDDGLIDEADEEDFPDGSIDDADENITYALYDFGVPAPDGDTDIGRNTGGGNQPLAENIDALNFVYLDANGNVLPTPVSPANLSMIRTVEITIVARTRNPDNNFIDANTVFTNFRGTPVLDMSAPPPTADFRRFHRRMLRTTVRLRNL